MNSDGFMDVQNRTINSHFGVEDEFGETRTNHQPQHHRRHNHGAQQPLQHPQQQQQQHRVKQVRRRLHTSRPYQERLLNMAEARREIVTALKFHRAAMKQTADKHQQQHHDESQSQSQSLVIQDQDQATGRMNSCRKNPQLHSSSSSTSMDYFSNYNILDDFPSPYSPASFNYPPPDLHFPYPSPQESLINLQALPDQTLGLNLNFHDFNTDFVATNRPYSYQIYNPPMDYSSSSSFPYTNPNSSGREAIEMVRAAATEHNSSGEGDVACGGGGEGEGGLLHAAMDEEGMAEIRSIGEKHQMEWDDALNLATSAWWSKFFNNSNSNMECGSNNYSDYGGGSGGGDDEYYRTVLHGCTEFPTWLSANDICLQQHFNDEEPPLHHSTTLPCVDIREIEGMDGEWLS